MPKMVVSIELNYPQSLTDEAGEELYHDFMHYIELFVDTLPTKLQVPFEISVEAHS